MVACALAQEGAPLSWEVDAVCLWAFFLICGLINAMQAATGDQLKAAYASSGAFEAFDADMDRHAGSKHQRMNNNAQQAPESNVILPYYAQGKSLQLDVDVNTSASAVSTREFVGEHTDRLGNTFSVWHDGIPPPNRAASIAPATAYRQLERCQGVGKTQSRTDVPAIMNGREKTSTATQQEKRTAATERSGRDVFFNRNSMQPQGEVDTSRGQYDGHNSIGYIASRTAPLDAGWRGHQTTHVRTRAEPTCATHSESCQPTVRPPAHPQKPAFSRKLAKGVSVRNARVTLPELPTATMRAAECGALPRHGDALVPSAAPVGEVTLGSDATWLEQGYTEANTHMPCDLRTVQDTDGLAETRGRNEQGTMMRPTNDPVGGHAPPADMHQASRRGDAEIEPVPKAYSHQMQTGQHRADVSHTETHRGQAEQDPAVHPPTTHPEFSNGVHRADTSHADTRRGHAEQDVTVQPKTTHPRHSNGVHRADTSHEVTRRGDAERDIELNQRTVQPPHTNGVHRADTSHGATRRGDAEQDLARTLPSHEASHTNGVHRPDFSQHETERGDAYQEPRPSAVQYTHAGTIQPEPVVDDNAKRNNEVHAQPAATRGWEHAPGICGDVVVQDNDDIEVAAIVARRANTIHANAPRTALETAREERDAKNVPLHPCPTAGVAHAGPLVRAAQQTTRAPDITPVDTRRTYDGAVVASGVQPVYTQKKPDRRSIQQMSLPNISFPKPSVPAQSDSLNGTDARAVDLRQGELEGRGAPVGAKVHVSNERMYKQKLKPAESGAAQSVQMRGVHALPRSSRANVVSTHVSAPFCTETAGRVDMHHVDGVGQRSNACNRTHLAHASLARNPRNAAEDRMQRPHTQPARPARAHTLVANHTPAHAVGMQPVRNAGISGTVDSRRSNGGNQLFGDVSVGSSVHTVDRSTPLPRPPSRNMQSTATRVASAVQVGSNRELQARRRL